jgi:hypothetical protein
LDSCLSDRLVDVMNGLYGDDGFEFLHVNSMVGPRTADTSWADTYKRFRGKLVISGDCRIAYRPHEAVAFIDNGFVSFFPCKGWGKLHGREQAAVLVHQWPHMQALASEKPSCWRFYFEGKRGNLKLIDEPLKKLEIPDDVLERTSRRIASRQVSRGG